MNGSYTDFTMLMCADGCIKGVADSLPQMEAEMSYFIDDTGFVYDNERSAWVLPLPFKIYNLGSQLGQVFDKWYTHNNPQYDQWGGANSDESNLLTFTLHDENLPNIYGANYNGTKSKDWKIDTTHKAHMSNPAYDPLTGLPNFASPSNEPNYIPNAEITQAYKEDGFALANWGVILRYKIKIYNDATQPKTFNYRIDGTQNIIVQSVINGTPQPAQSRGDYSNTQGIEHPEVMVSTPLQTGENEIVLEVILSTANGGGLPNYFIIN